MDISSKPIAMVATLLLAALIACLLNAVHIEAGKNRLKDFSEVYTVAGKLESAEILILGDELSANLQEQRQNNLELFVREPKVGHCARHYEKFNQVMSEYKKKAYEYVDDSRKTKNWLTSLASKVISPLNTLKGLSKFSETLRLITERYERQQKSGILTYDDVECDYHKYHIKTLDALLFVLQADIKYLITGEAPLVNKAIFEHLKQDKFVVENNFYQTHEPTAKQQELMLQFYQSLVAVDRKNLGEAIEHFQTPGAYVVGRILEACRVIPEYVDIWGTTEFKRGPACAKSTSDPQNDKFPNDFSAAKYAEVDNFCIKFFESL